MKFQLLIVTLLLASCSGSQKKVLFSESTEATSTVLTEALISIPMDITKRGNLLYVSDFNGDSLLYCYDIEKRLLVGKMLPQGQGADEFLPPVEYFMSDSSLFVHNRWHFTANNYSFNQMDFSIRPQGERIQLPMSVDRIYPIGESRFVASGVFDDCRFLVLDKNGEVVSRCGDFPNYQSGEEIIPNTAKAMFHQSLFGYNASRKRLACVMSNVVELWDYVSDSLQLYKRQLLTPYHYMFEASPDGVYAANDNPDAELGARYAATSDAYIYVLYNPNSYRMHDEHTETLNSEVWVFDWNGSPVRKILIDNQVECFCVDEEDQVLYCVMNQPDRCIGVVGI